jgi:fatty-acyl-CoA synthase
MRKGIYELGLDQNPANYSPLTPVSFLARTAGVFPQRTAVVYNDLRRTWAETYDRCRRLASALQARGVGEGDTVSIIAANIPEIYESHFFVPMSGAVLNTINTRLDAGGHRLHPEPRRNQGVSGRPEFSAGRPRGAYEVDARPELVVDILDHGSRCRAAHRPADLR